MRVSPGQLAGSGLKQFLQFPFGDVAAVSPGQLAGSGLKLCAANGCLIEERISRPISREWIETICPGYRARQGGCISRPISREWIETRPRKDWVIST